MTSAVLYHWKLKPGRDEEFRQAWEDGTRQIHQLCGSHGAILHKGEDGTYWSYACWPSEHTRQICFNETDWFSQECFQRMQDCIEERFEETRLELTNDLLQDRTPKIDPVILTTKRLILRPMSIHDAEALLPALTDDGNMRFWSSAPITTVDEARDYITWNVHGANIECFAITEQTDTARALGWIILMDRKSGQAEIGYILCPEAQGKGYALEAGKALIRHAFGVRKIRRLYADIDPDNAGSIALVERLGFQYEGCLRGAWKTHIGVRDSLMYGLLAQDLAS